MAEIIGERYKLGKLLGAGGTGAVYRAVDLRLKRKVAVKRANEKTRGKSKILERLLKEAEFLAQVDHPNVVMVHDILETPESVSIIMELVRGQPFVRLFRKRAIPERELVGYLRQLFAAVEAVHEVGLIHRDVNPRNVLVTSEGVIKLTDFGLSGPASDEEHRMGGTLAYMAPECLRKGTRLTFGVDVYSLGFMAYQAALGLAAFKKLYGARKPRDWIRFVLSRERMRTLRELRAPVSKPLSDLVERMLEKDASVRYRRMKDVRKDFDRFAGTSQASDDEGDAEDEAVESSAEAGDTAS